MTKLRISVEEIFKRVKELREREQVKKVEPSFFKRHLLDSPMFKNLFGVSYREYQALVSKGDVFSEVRNIIESIEREGMAYEIITDETGIIIDGGSRALYYIARGEPAEVKVYPIKCEESIENFVTCVFAMLSTLREKGGTEKFAQVVKLLSSGFRKLGIDIYKAYGIDFTSMAPTVLSAQKLQKIPEDVEKWIDEICRYLELPSSVGQIAKDLYVKVPILHKVVEIVKDEKSASFLTACAYVYWACKLHCMGSLVLRRILAFQPSRVRITSGEKKREIIQILERELFTRGFNFDIHEKMCIEAIANTFKLGDVFVREYEEFKKTPHYEVIRKHSPAVPDRVFIISRILLKKIGKGIILKELANRLAISDRVAQMFKKKLNDMIKEMNIKIKEINNSIEVAKKSGKVDEVNKLEKELNDVKNMLNIITQLRDMI